MAFDVLFVLLAPFVIYLVFASGGPMSLALYTLCFVVGGVLIALSRYLYRRGRLAYGLRTAGLMMFRAGMVVFVAGLALRGEWGFFWYAVVGLSVLILLASAGVFDSASDAGDSPQRER